MSKISHNVLGFDFGLVRIGVAMVNLQASIVHPLDTIHCLKKGLDYQQIDGLIEQWQPDQVVVGYPDKDSPPELLKGINRFIAYMEQRGLKVSKVNEAYTSFEAKGIIQQQRQQNLRKKTSKGDVDRIAACLILESWVTQQG